MRELAEWGLRSYIAEPDRGARQWKGRAAEQAAVYANRRRNQGVRGQHLQAQRGERVERDFAHEFKYRGMDRLWERGLDNVHKKLLLQAAACNLALLMRAWYGAGKPKPRTTVGASSLLRTLQLYLVCMRISRPGALLRPIKLLHCRWRSNGQSPSKTGDLETGC
jgi:hypothetical protein